MSCDYAIWHTARPLTPDQAGELYARLCEGDHAGVSPHSGIEALYRALITIHPEIEQVPEAHVGNPERCPWSGPFDRSPGHMIVSCMWPKADDVGDLLRSLSKEYGLAFYDPQSERLHAPGATASRKPWWRFW